MSIKLTDTQLVMLSAAAQREDRCIVAPPSLKGAAAQKIATKLVAAGFAKEIEDKPGAAPLAARRREWAGLRAEVDRGRTNGDRSRRRGATKSAVKISPSAAGEAPTKIVDREAGAGNIAGSRAIAMPREGSKLAAVVDLLRREDGATVEQLADAMGWLPQNHPRRPDRPAQTRVRIGR